jgi:hypothetical protein
MMDKNIPDGVQIVDVLSSHATKSLSVLLERGAFQVMVKAAHVATFVSTMIVCHGQQSVVFLREQGHDDRLLPLKVHETWEALSTHWATKEEFVIPNLLTVIKQAMNKYGEYKLTPTIDLLITTTNALTTMCRKCNTVYFSKVNRVWCLASHIEGVSLKHDQESLIKHWDSMSHQDRLNLVRPMCPNGSHEPLNPLAKKLWNVFNGQVDVSGSTLFDCLSEVTEETHVLRVSEPGLKKYITRDICEDSRDVLALIAHHLIVNIASACADSNAARLMDELTKSEQISARRHTSRQKKRHSRWVERTIFADDYKVQWDIIE